MGLFDFLKQLSGSEEKPSSRSVKESSKKSSEDSIKNVLESASTEKLTNNENKDCIFPSKGDFYKAKYKPTYQRQNVIIIALENSITTLNYRNEILKLLNKIIQDNASAFFLFICVSRENKYFNLSLNPKCLDYFSDEVALQDKDVELSEALNYIYSFIESHVKAYKIIDFDNSSYIIDNARIIFIGTGIADSNASNIENAKKKIKALHRCTKVNAFKYFCINDCDSIKVASLGFPIIGHIENDFYK